MEYKEFDAVIADTANELALAAGLVVDSFRSAPDFDGSEDSDCGLIFFCDSVGVDFPTPGTGCDTWKTAIKRVCSDKWWSRKLRGMMAREKETLLLGGCQVEKYSSDWIHGYVQHRFNLACEWMARNDLVEEVTGERVPFIDVLVTGQANRVNRRTELLIRIQAMEEIAEDLGYVGLFLTATLPSKYHLNSKKYNGFSPRESGQVLSRSWKKIREKCKREGVQIMGLRVAEAHKDATPHHHFCVFVHPGDCLLFTRICREIYLREDGKERGADEARFTYSGIDPDRGNAVSYCIVYISKSTVCTAETFERDSRDREYEGPDAETRVRAWASVWGIRQFQFFGAAPVGVWRCLRKVEPVTGANGYDDAATRKHFGKWYELWASCQGKKWFDRDPDYKDFTLILSRLADAAGEHLRLLAEETDEIGEYGDKINRVYGFGSSPDDCFRFALKIWRIELKKTAIAAMAGAANEGQDYHEISDILFDSMVSAMVDRRSAPARINVNNCLGYDDTFSPIIPLFFASSAGAPPGFTF